MPHKPHQNAATPPDTEQRLRETLRDALSLKDAAVADIRADTPLFGAMPELDSMAVATLLTEIEDRFGITIDDDDVDGEVFETFGSLTAFVQSKLG